MSISLINVFHDNNQQKIAAPSQTFPKIHISLYLTNRSLSCFETLLKHITPQKCRNAEVSISKQMCFMTITNQKYLLHLRLVWWNGRANDRNVYSTFHEDNFSKHLLLTIIKLSQKYILRYIWLIVHWTVLISISLNIVCPCGFPYIGDGLLWFWWLWCYYKGNIQDLLVIPVLSSTIINHLTHTRHFLDQMLFDLTLEKLQLA